MVEIDGLDEMKERYRDGDVHEHQPFEEWARKTLEEDLEREIRDHGWRQIEVED